MSPSSIDMLSFDEFFLIFVECYIKRVFQQKCHVLTNFLSLQIKKMFLPKFEPYLSVITVNHSKPPCDEKTDQMTHLAHSVRIFSFSFCSLIEIRILVIFVESKFSFSEYS